ncbi:hypothetical protein GXP70_12305 [Paenibacillus lycopersici]|uniref:YqaJ viral recombinase domain-containing protein n=1 Tax=Paenibacillus lycopersici TaxID=2704462 RepID=A0A6C0FZJ9_9BACL|nr:YqaJ viral recombinase family protein [Paenibacillus lycopersici]QHT60644.1 hypothetical protein GXP70_12305 [Paenibacillus lycopersici]
MAMSVAAVTKGIDRETWLKLRKKGIGGSDAAAVAGMNPWKSPVAVFLDKTGQLPEQEAGEPAYWGNVLEDVVAKEFAVRTGLKVQRSNKLYRHPNHPFMLGNVDRIVTDSNKRRGPLEVKTASAWAAEDWDNGKTPDHYALQLQHYLAVLGAHFGHFAVLIGGNRFEHRYVERDESLVKTLIAIEEDFWKNNVLKGIPPMVDGSGAATDLLNYLYPTSRPEHYLTLTDEQAPLITELREAQAAAKAADTRFAAAKNRLMAEMGDAEALLYAGEKVATWKSHDETRLDTKAIKSVEPELYEKYGVTKPVRKFLIKSSKED